MCELHEFNWLNDVGLLNMKVIEFFEDYLGGRSPAS